MAAGIPSVENTTHLPHESHKPTHVLLPNAIRAETEWSGERVSESGYGGPRSEAAIMSSDAVAFLAALTHLMQDPHTGSLMERHKADLSRVGEGFRRLQCM